MSPEKQEVIVASLSSRLSKPAIRARIGYFSRASRVVSHLLFNLNEPLSLREAARIANMERTAFAKFFSRSIGVPFKRFSTSLRIEVAISMMLESDLSLIEIAYQTGFEAFGTFERVFKRLTGEAPSGYRKRHLAVKLSPSGSSFPVVSGAVAAGGPEPGELAATSPAEL